MPHHSTSSEDDAILVDYDDVSNQNPEQILPQLPEVIGKIRNWLQPTDYAHESGEYHKHLASHMPGTASWLTSSTTFSDWRDGLHHGMLWTKGIPGSGKSVVAAHLVQILTQSTPRVPVLYFFFRQIIDANHKPIALLRDWMDQVLEFSPPLQERLKEIMENSRPVSSLSIGDMCQYLGLAFRNLPGKVFCVADALDEMDVDNSEFLYALALLGQLQPDKVKVLATSRPVPQIEDSFRRFNMLHIRLEENMVDLDISKYVEHMLQVLSDTSPGTQNLIKKAVPGHANGIFLYAKLAMDAFLQSGKSPEDVLK